MAATGVHVALLRAINVGGKNKLPMRDLAAMFVAAGCSDVRTYIQSGNVLYRAAGTLARRIPQIIQAAIAEKHGHRVPVVTRSAAELREVVRVNPFLRVGVDLEQLFVGFLADAPDAAHIAALDPTRSPPDKFEVHGREIYLRFPAGLARSKLTNVYFDSKLATTSTVRNWRTVLKLVDMTGAA